MTSAERPEKTHSSTSAHTPPPLAVLHVLEPTIAGVPAYVDHLGRNLAAQGLRQVVVAADREGFEHWDFGEWAERVEFRPWSRRSFDTFRIARFIGRLVDECSIDIVHAHATFAGIAARLLPIDATLVYQPHGWGFLTTTSALTSTSVRLVERLLAPRSDELLLLSEQEEELAPGGRTGLRVPPVVDVSRFELLDARTRSARRHQLGWDDDTIVHLCVGELSRRKNQVELVRHWRVQAPVDHRLVLVGDGASRSELEKTIGMDSRIEMLGWRSDVDQLMAAADSLVIPSLGEGFSLVVVEALVSGLPIFCTRIGGSEVVRRNDGAVAATVEEVVQKAVSSDLASRATDEERSARSQFHKKRFSTEAFTARFMALYRQVLDGAAAVHE